MLRKILLAIAAPLLVAYLVFVCFFFPEKAGAVVYRGIKIDIEGGARAAEILGEEDIKAQINAIDSLPIDRAISGYDTHAVERALRKNNALIEEGQLYFTPSGVLRVNVRRRVPLFLLLTPEGSYYVANKGEIIPCQSREKQVLLMPVVYGAITRDAAKTGLYRAVELVTQDSLWSTLFTDFYVDEKQNLFLSGPVVGCEVLFGKDLEAFPEQLERLHIFVDRAIPKFGWSAFQRLSLIVPGQVIATPTEEYALQRRSKYNSKAPQ